MRDYPHGAFEALSWVRNLLNEADANCEDCQKILGEVERILNEIQRAAGVDFPLRFSRERQ